MKFDIVINYDGPLELVHPYLKNVPIKDELIYPRRYSDEIAGMVSTNLVLKIIIKRPFQIAIFQ